MTDVITLAKERRAQLAAEIVKLDAFLRTARELAEDGDGFALDAGLRPDAQPDDELLLTDMMPEDDEQMSAHAGRMIRHRRWMMGMTQEDLSQISRIDVQDIQDYESGVRQITSGALREFAIAMKVPVSFFLQETSDEGVFRDVLMDQLITEL